jgi:hypothetical protein
LLQYLFQFHLGAGFIQVDPYTGHLFSIDENIVVVIEMNDGIHRGFYITFNHPVSLLGYPSGNALRKLFFLLRKGNKRTREQHMQHGNTDEFFHG